MNWVKSLMALGLPWIKKNGTWENCIWTNTGVTSWHSWDLTGFLLFNVLKVTLTLQCRCIIQSKAAATVFVLEQLSVILGSLAQWRPCQSSVYNMSYHYYRTSPKDCLCFIRLNHWNQNNHLINTFPNTIHAPAKVTCKRFWGTDETTDLTVLKHCS